MLCKSCCTVRSLHVSLALRRFTASVKDWDYSKAKLAWFSTPLWRLYNERFHVYSPLSSFWTFHKYFDIKTLNEDECHTKLWFFKKDLDKLLECLGIPKRCERKTVSSALDGILLKTLSTTL